jgi:hypothetical protein
MFVRFKIKKYVNKEEPEQSGQPEKGANWQRRA